MEENQTNTETPMVISNDKKKMPKGAFIGISILSIVTLASVAFGVYGMFSQSQKISDLETQIANCANTDTGASNNEATATTCPDNTIIENAISKYKNPVISTNSDKTYAIFFESSRNNDNIRVSIGVRDGQIEKCTLEIKTYLDEYGINSSKQVGECNITGLSGKIYKIIEIEYGHDNLYNNIGFIMDNGTVQYIPLFDAIENNDFSIKGALNIDGYVIDAFRVGAGPADPNAHGGYNTTIFVLSDGSYLEYSDSMLNN